MSDSIGVAQLLLLEDGIFSISSGTSRLKNEERLESGDLNDRQCWSNEMLFEQVDASVENDSGGKGSCKEILQKQTKTNHLEEIWKRA